MTRVLHLLLLACATSFAAPVLTRLDTLFLVAATGEPRFAAERARAESTLVALDTVTLAWLVRTGAEDRTPRQRHYSDRLFMLVADSGRNAGARNVLARAVAEAPDDTARAMWLHAVTRIGDSAARGIARPWLDSGSTGVRRMAAYVLGEYPHPDHVAALRAGLAGSSGAERHMRLWALSRQPPARDPLRLRDWVAHLGDSAAVNRGLARDRMLRDADSTWKTLRKHLPRDPSPALRREWWLLAAATRDEAGRAWLRREARWMTDEEKAFFGR